jgi:hypothetical protein
VLTAGERIYLLSRERQCRANAQHARDPAVKHIHLTMADAYARRAHAAEPEDMPYRASA